MHEVYAKLMGGAPVPCNDRRHFFALAAEAMRRILIDHARKHNAERRGGGAKRIPLSVVDLASDMDPSAILDLDAAITTLEAEDPRAAEVVRLRFFAGLTAEETAEAMQVSRRTVMREWSFARARLLQLMEPGPDPTGDGEE
ncbi:MAG: RNA polymerase sigma factor (TIGR02999 family) [Phycisphaerales bacterium]